MSRNGEIKPGGLDSITLSLHSELDIPTKKHQSTLAPETREAIRKPNGHEKKPLTDRNISLIKDTEEREQPTRYMVAPSSASSSSSCDSDTDFEKKESPFDRNDPLRKNMTRSEAKKLKGNMKGSSPHLPHHSTDMTAPKIQIAGCTTDSSTDNSDDLPHVKAEVSLTVDNKPHDSTAKLVFDKKIKLTKARKKQQKKALKKKHEAKKSIKAIRKSKKPKEALNNYLEKFWVALLNPHNDPTAVFNDVRITPLSKNGMLQPEHEKTTNDEKFKIDALNIVQHVKSFMRESAMGPELDRQIFEQLISPNKETYDRTSEEHKAKLGAYLSDSYLDFLSKVAHPGPDCSNEESTQINQFARWQASTQAVFKEAQTTLDQAIETKSLSQFQQEQQRHLSDLKQKAAEGQALLKEVQDHQDKTPMEPLADRICDRINNGVENVAPGISDLKKTEEKFSYVEKMLHYKELISNKVKTHPLTKTLTVKLDDSLEIKLDEKNPGELSIKLTGFTDEAQRFIETPTNIMTLKKVCRSAWFDPIGEAPL
ncbi:hypothetical protein [Endozoicomonas sp. Mp262]|uniref:hypothetical protein n=1 Tax=Endozoicomonas sp. Mp262 TaxID=2919499 RepID=UPI0021D853CE